MTEKGVTVTLNHDTQLPRPYSDSGDTKIPPMVQRLQGTEGIFFGSLEKIHIDGRSPCTSGKIRLPITNSTNIFCGRRLGEAARQRVLSTFSVERMVRQTESLYLRLLNAKRDRAGATWAAMT